jgi:hypothetical protein
MNFYLIIEDHQYILTNFFMYIKICSMKHTHTHTSHLHFKNINLSKLWIFHIIWIHALTKTIGHLGDVEICKLACFNWIHASNEPSNVTVAYENH